MVQSAQDRQAENAANGLNTARNRRTAGHRETLIASASMPAESVGLSIGS
jgi:hypothetical protein